MAAIIDGAADLVRGICGSRLPCLVPVKAHLRTRQVSGFTPVGLWMPPMVKDGFRFNDWTHLYTAPLQRKPLTEEEIRAVYGNDLNYRDGDEPPSPEGHAVAEGDVYSVGAPTQSIRRGSEPFDRWKQT